MIVDTVRDGYKYKVQVPDDAPEFMWYAGVLVGPPDLASLGLPPMVELRLHNELYVRGLITLKDVTSRRINELQAALTAAYKVDVNKLMEAYLNA